MPTTRSSPTCRRRRSSFTTTSITRPTSNTGNNLLKGTEFEGKSVEEVVKGSFGKNQPLFNNAGQHYNHIHFWQWMKPNGGGADPRHAREEDRRRISAASTSSRRTSSRPASTQFGSGWAWLAVKDGKLAIMKTPNGENPLVHGAKPILGVDVWEHSYYIDYRNRRPDYLKAFLDNLVNWEHVEKMYPRRRADPVPLSSSSRTAATRSPGRDDA